jgi:hypothetical protein
LSAAAAEIAARADLLAAGLRLDLTLGRRAFTR